MGIKSIFSICAVCIFFLIVSCNSALEKKEVWLGFQLGASTKENLKRMDQLATDGSLKIDEKSQIKYYTNHMDNGVDFYTTPWFEKSDTIVAKVNVLCLGNMLYASEDLLKASKYDNTDNLFDNNNFNQYAPDGLQSFNSTKIMKFLYDQLKEKYGECRRKDTSNFPMYVYIDYSWQLDGYNIDLVKKINLQSNLSTNSMVTLTYSYDQVTLEKLWKNKKKSDY